MTDKELWERANNIHDQYEENKEFYRSGWNKAIEKAAEIAVSDYHITKDEILKLKV